MAAGRAGMASPLSRGGLAGDERGDCRSGRLGRKQCGSHRCRHRPFSDAAGTPISILSTQRHGTDQHGSFPLVGAVSGDATRT